MKTKILIKIMNWCGIRLWKYCVILKKPTGEYKGIAWTSDEYILAMLKQVGLNIDVLAKPNET